MPALPYKDTDVKRLIFESPDGCWLWTRSTTRDGYGWLRFDGRTQLAHRVFYAIFVGDPSGGEVHHTCCNRDCVNPDHLELCADRAAHMARHASRLCRKGHERTRSGDRLICKVCMRDYDRARNRRNKTTTGVTRPERRTAA